MRFALFSLFVALYGATYACAAGELSTNSWFYLYLGYINRLAKISFAVHFKLINQ